MNIRLLKNCDRQKLEDYLLPHRAESMFICSNLKSSGLEYKKEDFQGEYFGYFDRKINRGDNLLGVIVHYWNGNIVMHVSNPKILRKLVLEIKREIKRPISGILGPDSQVNSTIKDLGLSNFSFAVNEKECLYKISLVNLDEINISSETSIIPAKDAPENLMISWMIDYNIEALGALNDDNLKNRIEQQWMTRLKKNDSWVLLWNKIPVSMMGFNARIESIVQIGPVWTPVEYRRKKFARLLLTYKLYQEKLNGTKEAVLFTKNPAAASLYNSVGFERIGNYRLALLEKSVVIGQCSSKE